MVDRQAIAHRPICDCLALVRPKSIVDNRKVLELARSKINGDLERLGGLLKLWFINDARTAQFGDNVIQSALARIEDTQVQMVEVMKSIILPRSELYESQ